MLIVHAFIACCDGYMQAKGLAQWELQPLQVCANKATLAVNLDWLQQLQVSCCIFTLYVEFRVSKSGISVLRTERCADREQK